MNYKPYIPQDVSELLDELAYMMLYSPTFKDKTGYFPRENVDTVFCVERGASGSPQEVW
jgi:hypothetical protein